MKILIPLNSETLHSIREVLVDVLGVDMEDLSRPDVNFYDDLGGESIDVLDLNFHLEKRWGVKLTAKSFADRLGTLSPTISAIEANEVLKSEFPFANGIELEERDIRDPKRLMTLEFITYMVDFERSRQ